MHRGDTLLVLEDAEFRIRLEEANAALLDAKGAKDVLHSGIEASRKNIAIQDAAASHRGYDGPLLLTNAGFYGILQDQGLLLGIKILFGYLLLAAVLLAVLSAMIPFHKTVKVPVVKAGADMA